jgi:hypothetical protein
METLHVMGIVLLLVTIGTITHPTVYAALLGPQPKNRSRKGKSQGDSFTIRVYPNTTDSR